MNSQEASMTTEALAALAFFPPPGAARALIADELTEMCPTIGDGMWLAKRAVQLHRSWSDCGVMGLWQIWFSAHRPRNASERGLDRRSGSSEAYPDGLPPEHGEPEWLQLPKPREKALPLDPEAGKALAELAKEITMRAREDSTPRPRLLQQGASVTAENFVELLEAERQKKEAESL